MIFKLFLLWRVGLFLVTYLGSITFPLMANGGIGAIAPNKQFDFWASWAQWDGGHYFDIAQNGYQSLPNYAFFPLYPYLIRISKVLFFGDLLATALVISNFAFLLFLLVFFKLLKEKYSSKVAFNSMVTIMVFPTTFFAVAFYPESLMLLLIILFFFFLNSKNYLMAAITASFASLTKLIGIFLMIPLFYSYFVNVRTNFKNIDRRLLHLLVAPIGFSVYGLYLFAKHNDPFKFLTVQSFWQRSLQDPFSTIFSYFWSFLTLQSRPPNDYIDLSLTLIFLVILILGVKKIPSSWWIFSILVILIPASTGTLTSMPRYLLASLGVFAILGQYFSVHRHLKIAIWIFSLVFQSILAVLFINGYWVA